MIVAMPRRKGDMRHTYADTSLARADLGSRPTVDARGGPGGRVSWLARHPVIA